jgi:hypothetical protein
MDESEGAKLRRIAEALERIAKVLEKWDFGGQLDVCTSERERL